MEVIENLMEIEDEGDPYDSIEDLWPDLTAEEREYRFVKDHPTAFISGSILTIAHCMPVVLPQASRLMR